MYPINLKMLGFHVGWAKRSVPTDAGLGGHAVKCEDVKAVS
jgi:hypothetical protein